jgi:hypothetical protein
MQVLTSWKFKLEKVIYLKMSSIVATIGVKGV